MTVIKYDPFNPFEQFKLISDTLFRDVFNGVNPDNLGKGFPTYDQYAEKDGSLVLEFALAGYKQTDLSISVDGNQLTVAGQKQADNNVRYNNKLARRAFNKTLFAGDDLDLEAVSACFEDGLLQIKIPLKKVDIVKPKVVEIKSK